ncbi:hypothetical protein F383_36916 [Gossypium arboreum]|uniref:Uncharacterized protein n=1 Tax=Gossypium arboreum TaxID=29729 RepID=A0A0B0MG81_GOSAR|nr:hypothetical protein F383_36916 [Gossypium arboreum]
MIHETESTGHVQEDGVVTSVKSDLISLKLQWNRSKIANLISLKLQWSRLKCQLQWSRSSQMVNLISMYQQWSRFKPLALSL